jgi:hypothetical protein
MQAWVALATPVLVVEIIAQQFVGDKPNIERVVTLFFALSINKLSIHSKNTKTD